MAKVTVYISSVSNYYNVIIGRDLYAMSDDAMDLDFGVNYRVGYIGSHTVPAYACFVPKSAWPKQVIEAIDDRLHPVT